MGIFPRLPLRLRAEPRLWGAVVLDHPKNPPALRGKGFAMESLLTRPGAIYARVRDAAGDAVRLENRDAWLLWEGTRNARVFAAARQRWLLRSLKAGTLDVVCGDPWRQRDERWAFWYMMVPMSVGLALMLWFYMLLPLINAPQAQRTLIDWLGVCIFLAMIILTMGGCLWIMSLGRHRSCSLYRLTSTAITPLDGPLGGNELRHDACTGHDKFGLHLSRLRFGDRTLIIDPPPLGLAKLLDREEEEKGQNRRVYRRLYIYGAVGLVLFVASVVVTQPITGVPIWRPLLGLAIGGPIYILLGLCGERWMNSVFAGIERRSRQRKNRHAAASGRAS